MHSSVLSLTSLSLLANSAQMESVVGETARHGHFGRELPQFSWEKTDKAEALKKAAGV